jgi:hypothetical protein
MTISHNTMGFISCRILVYMYPGVNVTTLGSRNIDCIIRVTSYVLFIWIITLAFIDVLWLVDVLFFVFHFILYILPFTDFFFVTIWWWYIYISRFYFSLQVCLDASFCYYSSVYIDAMFVLLVVFDPSMLVLSTCIKYNT